MENLFLTVLGMSGTAAVVILLVLLARLALRKAPKVFSYTLWAVVLLRLLCPFAIRTPWSLTPSIQVKPAGEGLDMVVIDAERAEMTIRVNDFPVGRSEQAGSFVQGPSGIPDGSRPDGGSSPGAPARAAVPVPSFWSAASAVWLAGAALLLGYSVLSLLRLRRSLVGAVPLAGEKNVRLADHIPSPFVLGLVFPKIYLPSDLPESERDYILLHERTHIRRCDHIFRALAWAALAAHWFNPLVWLAFHLAGKDMEMSCDEAVLRQMGRDVRADYSTSLLRLSQGGKLPAGPLAFGGGSPQGRIKNILGYKKPAVWVVALALAAVLCAGVALATDQEQPLIDSGSVTSVTAITAASSTTTPDRGVVYTEADRQKDLGGPAKGYMLTEEEGAGLVRLLNQYRKSVYAQGELEDLSGREHQLYRIDCTGGDFYLADYWYWNGFSFNPLHFGEDSYTTLVTYYDAQGNAGTTWQMEYSFDRAYHDWRSGLDDKIKTSSADLSGLTAGLTFSLEEGEDEPYVRMEGSVGDEVLKRGATWHSGAVWGEHPYGELSLVYPAFTDEIEAHLMAWWTDEGRTSVTMSTNMTAMFSSQFNVGWWEFTVDLTSGTVTGMTARPFREGVPDEETRFYPRSITDEEAVTAARVAAKLLTAAEDFYANARSGALLGFTPVYAMYEAGHVRVTGEGLGRRAYLDWSEADGLYFAGDPGGLCPALAGKPAEGSADWADQDRTALEVLFSVGDERVSGGTVDGFFIQFTVDLENGEVVEKNFQSQVEGETLELTDEEMTGMARILAVLMRGAEDYYESDPPLAPAEPFVPTVLGVSYSLNETGTAVTIGGLDCPAAAWYPSSLHGEIHPRPGLPEGGALGYLTTGNPRFLGGYFANAYGNALVLYYPEENGPLLAVCFDDYTNSVYDPGLIFFAVDLASGQVKNREISGYSGQAPEFSDGELASMAGMLAGMIHGASDYYADASNPPAEEGPLPFDQPMRLWFGSGAGAWRTIMTLHPDGSFEGRYDDNDLGVTGEGYPMGTQYTCTFHGRFGDVKQVTDASWSLTLEELTLDTGHPVGEEWIAERTRYISSGPYGLDGEDGGPLKPGARFVFYTPDASGKPGGELYGMENESSGLHDFWIWWPERYAVSEGRGGVLGCYALRNVETGYGFFDLQAWGIAPEQPRDY